MVNFDVIVVGGGPAGSAAALFAARAGLKTLLLEKAVFPRDKTCGDALSGKSVFILRKLGLLNELELLPQVSAKGVVFSSPKGDMISIKFRGAQQNNVSGYVCKRIDFDYFLFNKSKSEVASCLEGFKTIELIRNGKKVVGIKGIPAGEDKPQEFRAKVVIGADGYKSFVSRQLGLYNYNSRHTMVAIRGYYEGVTEVKDFIEIHYVKVALPGYFWIFPLPNGQTNVGLGMRHIDIKRKKIDLYRKLDEIIESDLFRHRFVEARRLSKIKGWNLPVGSIFRPNHSDGVLLIGDAAGLIDPFTGEGMGNALTSANLAIEVVKKAIEKNDFSKAILSEYDRLLKDELSSELKLSTRLHRIMRKYPFLINFTIRKAGRNKDVEKWLSSMVADETPKNNLTKPLTYLKLLFS